jgi:small-conductance mechanosensitive channel
MKRTPQLTFAALLLLTALALVAWVLTDNSAKFQSQKPKTQDIPAEFVVDKTPLTTARDLAAWAATPDDQDLARGAERVADHEVDLDFASALRRVSALPPQTSPEAKALEDRVREMEAQIKKDQDTALDLQKKAEHASEADKPDLEGASELADAQLALDEDEIADAKGDLERVGADVQTKVVKAREQHEKLEDARSAMVYGGAMAKGSAPANSFRAHAQEWFQLRGALTQVRAAQQDATNAAAQLSAKHDALEKQVHQEEARKTSLTNGAALQSVQQLSLDQRSMAELDKRIQDHQELAGIYGRWLDSLQIRKMAATHSMMQTLLWITLIVLVSFLLGRAVERALGEATPDHKRLLTLRTVIRFLLKTAALVGVLYVLFGAPEQMPTILGLVGAGLTVALQGFIVGFCGWFILMGRNGIRVGDWVEINGVGGEVVEIGLLRTVLLETGSASGSGYPTGRQVAFVNSYAVSGHYFNFSTSGQWLWDELLVQVPVGEDSSAMVENILQMVTKETDKNARMAEQEWERVTHRYGVKSFSAAPSISVRPASLGVEIVVRYITRAQERYEVRSHLYQAVVEILHQKKGLPANVDVASPAART